MNEIDEKRMGSLIKELREKNGFSKSGLAKLIDVSPAAISQWEKGEKGCSTERLMQLSELFDVTVDELVDGKLLEEGSNDYLLRNYDLSSYDVAELVEKEDERTLAEYFRKCLAIKKRYYEMLPVWVEDNLSTMEIEEFKYLRRYAAILITPATGDMIGFRRGRLNESQFKRSVKEVLDKTEGLSEKARLWELEKIHFFNFGFEPNDLLSLAGTNAFGLMLDLMNQQYKDELLAKAIHETPQTDLYRDLLVPQLLSHGANCVYRYYLSHNCWDEELIDAIEGEMVEDLERTEAASFCVVPGFNPTGQLQIYGAQDDWKRYSYEEYQRSIQKKKNAYIEALVYEKYVNPITYFSKLKAGEYDTYPNK